MFKILELIIQKIKKIILGSPLLQIILNVIVTTIVYMIVLMYIQRFRKDDDD